MNIQKLKILNRFINFNHNGINFVPYGLIVQTNDGRKKVTNAFTVTFEQNGNNCYYNEDYISVKVESPCSEKEFVIKSKDNSYEQPLILNEECKGSFYANKAGTYFLYNSTSC